MTLERDIEYRVVDIAKKHGWLSFKFVSPAQRGVPDRIFMKSGRIVFIEFKAPGKKPTPLQDHIMRKMVDAGCEVHVCYSIEDGCNALQV
jgi:hypothetical protein